MDEYKRVVATDELPIELWHDLVAQDGLWTALVMRCGVIASQSGYTIVHDEEHRQVRSVEFARLVSQGDEATMMTCSEKDAEFALLRLICWVKPK